MFIIVSCKKEMIYEAENVTGSLNIENRSLNNMKLDTRSLNELEETELLASKILAFKIKNDQSFRLSFVESLFNTNGLPKENVFLCKVFDVISEVEIRGFLQTIGKTSEDYNQFLDKLNQDYPLLVAKVPLWYSGVWSLSGEDGFNSTSHLLNDIRFIPFIEDIDTSNYYNTYRFNNSIIENEIINSRNVNFDYLPVLIRQSEYHRLVDVQNLRDQWGNPLFDPHQINDDPQSPCYTIGILSKHIEPIVCISGDYSIVNWISFLQELYKCPPPTSPPIEDCHNGIDDDGDGLVDCDDPDCDCTEICDNGIDDDGDGFIDADDPDCCWFYAGCDRDCVAETNHIVGLKFVNNYVGLFHNHEPTFNDITGIKVVTYEFVGSAGAVPGIKEFYYPFMKLCGIFNPVPEEDPQNSGLNPDFKSFYSAHWDSELDQSSYTGISVSDLLIVGTQYLLLTEPLLVNVNVKWQDNWDGTSLGDRVRGEVFYLSSDIVSTSQSSTYTTQVVTKLGASFGAHYGVSGGNPNTGVNVGYTWDSEETETVQSKVLINISPADKSIGTFDMNYCESNSPFFFFDNCTSDIYSLNTENVEGTHYSTGAIEIWSFINR